MAVEAHTQPQENQAPTEKELEFRKVVASLMAPFMFDSIKAAQRYAQAPGAHDPKARYSHLAAVTMVFLRDPESREAYMARYPDVAAHFDGPEGYFTYMYDYNFPRLIVPAIQDAYKTGCGAANFLEAQGRSSEASEIIPRSTGLLAVSRVSRTGALEINKTLGYPIDPRFLDWESRGGQEAVGLTAEAQAVIAEHPSPKRGCPAYALEDPRPGSPAPSLLTAYWQEISVYAFPPTDTVNLGGLAPQL